MEWRSPLCENSIPRTSTLPSLSSRDLLRRVVRLRSVSQSLGFFCVSFVASQKGWMSGDGMMEEVEGVGSFPSRIRILFLHRLFSRTLECIVHTSSSSVFLLFVHPSLPTMPQNVAGRKLVLLFFDC